MQKGIWRNIHTKVLTPSDGQQVCSEHTVRSIRMNFSQKTESAFTPSSMFACVCPCDRALPLLTRVCCSHLISQQPRPLGDRCCYLQLFQQSANTAPIHLKYQSESAGRIISILTEKSDHKRLLNVDTDAHILNFSHAGAAVPALWPRL